MDVAKPELHTQLRWEITQNSIPPQKEEKNPFSIVMKQALMG
jgi:hypothetical protein